MLCPHAGQATVVPSSPRVLLGGRPAATAGDQWMVAGCAFTVPPSKPQPCLTVRWTLPSLRVRIGGQPAVLATSAGLCLSPEQAPQGPPSAVVTQLRARGA